eukprot:4636923-Pleurochrysis_carterae.AAC.1
MSRTSTTCGTTRRNQRTHALTHTHEIAPHEHNEPVGRETRAGRPKSLCARGRKCESTGVGHLDVSRSTD